MKILEYPLNTVFIVKQLCDWKFHTKSLSLYCTSFTHEPKVTAGIQDYVRRYLDIHEVEAEYIIGEHGAMEFLKQTVEERQVDLVLMGSHGGTMLQQVFIGRALDYMLRESKVPIFICR